MTKMSKKKTILCVDDDQAVLVSLKSQLKLYYKDEYNYETALTPNEALEIITKLYEEGEEVLLVISDWLLQGMKGDEFLIFVHKKYPEISTILLTGHATDRAIENAKKNANLLTCLNKPWSLEDLIDAISLARDK